ncbi:MAG: hypothetical protein AAF589_05010 [Planctomycetota bacterium]
MRPFANHHRPGYTLIELLVATASSGVLLAGMASTLYIASQSLDIDSGAAAQRITLSAGADQVVNDLRHATHFYEKTPTAVTFSVPDRTGDGVEETIRYAWGGGVGDPLTMEFNGSAAVAVVQGVTSLNLTYVERLMLAEEAVADDGLVQFREFTEATVTTFEDEIDILTPTGAVENDLLIACVALDGNQADELESPADWTEITTTQHANRVTLGVWWKLAAASEPATHRFTWDSDINGYGWIMRFDGHDPSGPIEDSAIATGKNSGPLSPGVTTTTDGCLILRLGGFDNNRINTDETGIADHITITMDTAVTLFEASGGAAYTTLDEAGDAGDLSFLLTGSEEYVTVTLAIKPEEP